MGSRTEEKLVGERVGCGVVTSGTAGTGTALGLADAGEMGGNHGFFSVPPFCLGVVVVVFGGWKSLVKVPEADLTWLDCE